MRALLLSVFTVSRISVAKTEYEISVPILYEVEPAINRTQALLLTASRDCKCQLRAGARVSFSLKPQDDFGPGVPKVSHAITPSAPSMTILATRTILSRDPPPQTDKGAVAGGLVAAIAIVTIAALGFFFLRWRHTRVSPTEFIADPVPNEAGVPMTINTQPEPSIENIKGSSDDEVPGLSTMPDLPTPPMKVYVRTSAPLLRSRLFILCLGPLGSEQCSNVSRAARRSVCQEYLFPGNFWTVPRHRNHARTTGQHTSPVATRAYYPAHTSRATIRSVCHGRFPSKFRTVSRHREHPQTNRHASASTTTTQWPAHVTRAPRRFVFSERLSPSDFRTASGHGEHRAQYPSLATTRIWRSAHCLISPFEVYP